MTPVERARSLLGKPWEHQTRGPHSYDCAGMVEYAFADYGIRGRVNYDRNPSGGELEAVGVELFGPPIPKDQMRAGDVVLMAFPTVVRHVGIIANHPLWPGVLTVIHTWAGGPRCVTETAIDAAWLKRIKFVHRLEAAQ
jgi:cell wall-associated NlpC family hydrolase